MHYHFERPKHLTPAYTWFRGKEIETDLDQDFLELETVRLYRKEDTLWELDNVTPWGPQGDVTVASDPTLWENHGGFEFEACYGEGRFPSTWPSIRIPTPQRYIEALILLWIRHEGGHRELAFFFRLHDMVSTLIDSSNSLHILNRMEPPFRTIMQSLIDHCDTENDDHGDTVHKAGINPEDIMKQSIKILGPRAAGPMRYDPNGLKYEELRRKDLRK